MRTGARAGAALTAAAAVLTLGACGSDSSTTATDPAAGGATSSSTSPSAQPSTPTSPTCVTVWKGGQQLDASYAGCATDQGWVKAQVYQCSDGHRVVTFAHAFYAQPGRKITRSDTTLAKDPAFRHMMAACGA